jgi:hypothetical protein
MKTPLVLVVTLLIVSISVITYALSPELLSPTPTSTEAESSPALSVEEVIVNEPEVLKTERIELAYRSFFRHHTCVFCNDDSKILDAVPSKAPRSNCCLS